MTFRPLYRAVGCIDKIFYSQAINFSRENCYKPINVCIRANSTGSIYRRSHIARLGFHACQGLNDGYPNHIEHRTFKVQSNNKPDKPSLYQRFKLMYKEYWYILVPVHLFTSAFWIGGFYYLAITGVDVVNLLEIIGAPDSWVSTMRESKAGGIVSAYTMYKIATPARYTVTLGGTTVSINYLKTRGWIKPIPSKEALQEMYEDKKLAIKEKITTTRDEIKDEFVKTKDDILKTKDDLAQQVKEARSGLKKGVVDTRVEFKQGVMEAADEWKHIGKLMKQRTKEIWEEGKAKDGKNS